MKGSERGSKGISPLIATVLLIAFTVAVAGIVSVWITTFTTTSTQSVSGHSETELVCVYAGVKLSDLKYCSSNGRMSGIVENTNLIDLGNITLQVIYQNASSQKIYLCLNGSSCNALGASTMALTPREKQSFNVSIGGSNYDKIHLYTNCTNAYYDLTSGDVSSTC
jgi:flagellin-like protein